MRHYGWAYVGFVIFFAIPVLYALTIIIYR
jgi:hypothetical protein